MFVHPSGTIFVSIKKLSTMEEKPQATEAFLTIHDTPVYFQEDWDTGIGGGLWSTGLAMGKYLEINATSVRTWMEQGWGGGHKRLSVLELGSGNGFLSVCMMALARDLISELVVTDLEDHLDLIQQTFDANPHLLLSDRNYDEGEDKAQKVSIVKHEWGKFTQEEEEEEEEEEEGEGESTSATSRASKVHERSLRAQFDLILGSDVAYHHDLYDILITSLQRFSHDRTVSLIGVTMNDTKPLFFAKLRNAGFQYERLADHLLPTDFRGTTFGIFAIRKRKTTTTHS